MARWQVIDEANKKLKKLNPKPMPATAVLSAQSIAIVDKETGACHALFLCNTHATQCSATTKNVTCHWTYLRDQVHSTGHCVCISDTVFVFARVVDMRLWGSQSTHVL